MDCAPPLASLFTFFQARRISSLLATAVLLWATTGGAGAQPSPNWAFDSRVLFVGAFANVYHAGGAKPHVAGCNGFSHPAWYPYTCNQTGQGLWLAAKNFTDASGKTWD